MVETICHFIHNYFTSAEDIHSGEYVIENGSVTLPFLVNGQYFRIVGSVLNDGIYQYPEMELRDETFTGEIWAMKVPRQVVLIANEAQEWLEKNGAALMNPLSSESFEGYSYSKDSAVTGGGLGGLFGKNGIFGARLNQWRKLG